MYFGLLMTIPIFIMVINKYLKFKRYQTNFKNYIVKIKHNSVASRVYLVLTNIMISWFIIGFSHYGKHSLWIIPLVLSAFLQWYITSKPITIYSQGIQVFGDYINKESIADIYQESDGSIVIVTKDSDSKRYCIDKCENSDVNYLRIRELLV